MLLGGRVTRTKRKTEMGWEDRIENGSLDSFFLSLLAKKTGRKFILLRKCVKYCLDDSASFYAPAKKAAGEGHTAHYRYGFLSMKRNISNLIITLTTAKPAKYWLDCRFMNYLSPRSSNDKRIRQPRRTAHRIPII